MFTYWKHILQQIKVISWLFGYSLQWIMFTMLSSSQFIFRILKMASLYKGHFGSALQNITSLSKYHGEERIEKSFWSIQWYNCQKVLATRFHFLETLLSQIIYAKYSWPTKQRRSGWMISFHNSVTIYENQSGTDNFAYWFNYLSLVKETNSI